MDKRPNIIFIVADDLGYADLSCCGQTDFETPNLDRLAREGTRFTQAYANSSLCTPTRISLMTGRYHYRVKLGLAEPLRHSAKDDPEMGLPADHPTLPSLLRTAGYETALIGKWHLGALPHHGPLKSGYDTFWGVMGGYTGYFTKIGDGGEPDFYDGEQPAQVGGYVTELLSDRAVRYIEQRAKADRPFFLSLHYTAPHWPWSSPSVEAAARVRESNLSTVFEGGSPKIYGEMVQVMDRGIGDVMAALRRAGLADNTLVLFASDNGGERYSKIWPFVGRKRDLLEGGLRVPQIVWWPGRVRNAQVTDQVAISMDLTATCLAAAGAMPSAEYPLDGIDLLPFLDGRKSTMPRTLFWRMREREQRAVRFENWKYLKVENQEFLFDLDYDWRERADFKKDHPDLLNRLRTMWEDWDRTMLPWPDNSQPVMAALSKMLW